MQPSGDSADSSAAPSSAPQASRRMLALVLALAFLFTLAGRGLADSYIVFQLPLASELGLNRSETTSVYSLLMIVGALSAPMVGMLYDRHGPRVTYGLGLALVGCGLLAAALAHGLIVLYLGVSLLIGCGTTTLGVVSAAGLVRPWFPRRTSTAMGFAFAGMGCGLLSIIPLAQFGIEHIGWRKTYFVAAAIVCALWLASQLLLPWRRLDAARRAMFAAGGGAKPGDATTRRAALTAALRTREFWGLAQVFFFTSVMTYVINIQSVPYLVHSGFPAFTAALAVGVAGALSLLGVVSAGAAADGWNPRISAAISYSSSFAGIGCLAALGYFPSTPLLCGFVLFYGIAQGARGPLVASLSHTIFKGPASGTIFGAIYMGAPLGAAAGAMLSGVLYDLTQSFTPSFVLVIVAIMLGGSPFWSSALRRHQK